MKTMIVSFAITVFLCLLAVFAISIGISLYKWIDSMPLGWPIAGMTFFFTIFWAAIHSEVTQWKDTP